MPNLKLTFACDNYAYMRALREETVRPDGIDLTYLSTFPAETFQRMIQFKEFDVSEMGMKFYVSTLGLDDPPFIAIPVFPSRAFRHSAVYVGAAGKIEAPRDLIGKKIGELFAYGHDAAIWARGIMSDEYGVPIDSPTYYVGRLDQGTSREFEPFRAPPQDRVEEIGPTATLDGMLARGEIDALYSAIVPPSLVNRAGTVRRLFPDYESVERDYYKRTGIFPIMHTVAIRRELYRRHPWIAQSLYKAFKDAKRDADALVRAHERHMNRLMNTPWQAAHFEENRTLLGDDPWPYGVEPNRKTLETFLRYHYEQGLAKRRFAVDELFAPETLVDYLVYRAPH